jgi:hypothetical protein
MKLAWSKFTLFSLVSLVGCKGMHSRPESVPSSAVWVDDVFIDCSVETQSKANRCTVYKDTTGEILADGLFVLNNSRRPADKSELHYAAFGKGVIYLEDARMLVQREPSRRDPSNRIVGERLKTIAARGSIEALDCNNATPKSDLPSECAIRAFSNNRPFYVRFYLQGPDAFRFYGLARDADGNAYEAWFLRGNVTMTGKISLEAQFFDENQTIVTPCPKPIQLSKLGDILTCARVIE